MLRCITLESRCRPKKVKSVQPINLVYAASVNAVLYNHCMQRLHNQKGACCLTCGDDGVNDLQDCAHEVSIHSMLSSKLPGRGQGGGVQVGGAQWGAYGGASIQGATAAPSTYPLIPVSGDAR